MAARPPPLAEHRSKLTLTTSMNKSFKLSARGQGRAAPLRMSHTVLRLGAAVPGEVQTASVFLTNTTNEAGAWAHSAPGRCEAGCAVFRAQACVRLVVVHVPVLCVCAWPPVHRACGSAPCAVCAWLPFAGARRCVCVRA
jgi:hypothetical protein